MHETLPVLCARLVSSRDTSGSGGLMALIERFVERPRVVGKIHPTRTVCQYSILNVSGTSVLQLDTRGSDDREMPEKVSQTLQLDEQGAATLLKIIRATFPNLK